MLTPVDDAAPVAATTTTTEPAPDKQICVMNNTASAVAYTVPTGRKFVGYIGHQYGLGGYYMEVTTAGTSSTTMRYYGGVGAEPNQYRSITTVEHTFLAGTSMKNSPSGSQCYVLGVESDA
tara:strand:+ start:1869 stop:2231 length:363 start_codon:yes stop_codon:yes gene_type:complete